MIRMTNEIAAKAHREAALAHREFPNSEAAQDATDDAAECVSHLDDKTEALETADSDALEACWHAGDSAAAAAAHDRAADELERLGD